MTIRVLLPAVALLFISCDFMLKEREDANGAVEADKKVVLGNDRDDKGCVTSAGYRWSLLRKECIRVFEEGYRLNRVDSLKAEDRTVSAFVVFDKDEKEAELYLPGSKSSFVMKKDADNIYKNGAWVLNKKSYQLRNSGRVVYAGAKIQENKVITDDWKGGSLAPAQPIQNDSLEMQE